MHRDGELQQLSPVVLAWAQGIRYAVPLDNDLIRVGDRRGYAHIAGRPELGQFYNNGQMNMVEDADPRGLDPRLLGPRKSAAKRRFEYYNNKSIGNVLEMMNDVVEGVNEGDGVPSYYKAKEVSIRAKWGIIIEKLKDSAKVVQRPTIRNISAIDPIQLDFTFGDANVGDHNGTFFPCTGFAVAEEGVPQAQTGGLQFYVKASSIVTPRDALSEV